jgi:hypothetical protein
LFNATPPSLIVKDFETDNPVIEIRLEKTMGYFETGSGIYQTARGLI